jgi:hypothetical protein
MSAKLIYYPEKTKIELTVKLAHRRIFGHKKDKIVE